MLRRLLVCLIAGSLTASLVYGAESKPASPVGRKIDDFTLPDAAGKKWSLRDAQDAKATVVLFLGTECPINNAYMPRLAELHKEYAAKGVQFVAINANQLDTPQRVAEHAKRYFIPFTVLKDAKNTVADRFGAERTPEAFVLDANRVIRYRGRIDDQIGIGYKRPKATRNDLAEAVEEVLAGKAVSQPTTEVAGCYIARAPRVANVNAAVTFSKHVAPILQKHCQECHRPGRVGPMSLLTYDDAAPWAETIRQVIEEKRMPPWHADPKHGSFINDRRMPDGDRDTIVAWVNQGCAPGRAEDMPPPRDFVEGWSIGKPDVVLSMPTEFSIPARAEKGVRYQYFMVPTGFDEDRYVQAAEIHPGNPELVHHVIVFIRKPGDRGEDRTDGVGGGMLCAYAPGDQPITFPPGTARLIPKGQTLVFQMHYTPNGTPGKDRTSVGLIFAKEKPQHVARARGIAQKFLMIPPGADNHQVTSKTTFERDALLWTIFPHMHLRGKDFEYKAVFPDGREEILLSVPRYDFNWQTIYRLDKPVALPKGTRIECTAHFDNSAKNPNNPDPTKLVRWGDQTWEEMMIGFVDYSFSGPPEPEAQR